MARRAAVDDPGACIKDGAEGSRFRATATGHVFTVLAVHERAVEVEIETIERGYIPRWMFEAMRKTPGALIGLGPRRRR